MAEQKQTFTHTVPSENIRAIKAQLTHDYHSVTTKLPGELYNLGDFEVSAELKQMREDKQTIQYILEYLVVEMNRKPNLLGTALFRSDLCTDKLQALNKGSKSKKRGHEGGPASNNKRAKNGHHAAESGDEDEDEDEDEEVRLDVAKFKQRFNREPVPHIIFGTILNHLQNMGGTVKTIAIQAQGDLSPGHAGITEAVSKVTGIDDATLIKAMKAAHVEKIPYLRPPKPQRQHQSRPARHGKPGAPASEHGQVDVEEVSYKNDFSVLDNVAEVTGGWVVGDQFYTPEEYVQLKATEEHKGAALAVKKVDDKIAAWDEYTAQNLTYYIDLKTFTDKSFAKRAAMWLKKAGQAWSSVCNVQFKQVDTAGQALFKVQFDNSSSNLLAYAFFPEYQKHRRVVTLYKGLETLGFDPVGVLRHELGHVLGFRHEHCRFIGVNMQKHYHEDISDWVDVTPPDRKSVMNWYLPDQNVGTVDLKITLLDALGAQCVYPFHKNTERFGR